MVEIRIITLLSIALQHVLRGHVPPTDLVKSIISEGLGLGIVAGSCLVKVPQIVKLVSSSSAQGLNPTSFEIETFCATVAATYGFVHKLSFNAFGESVAIGLQNIVLLFLIYKYQKRSLGRRVVVLVGLMTWLAAAQGGHLTAELLNKLFDLNSIILLVSRIPQITQNYRSKSTGQLSFITYLMNFLGTMARVFTTLQEQGGAAMLRGVIMSMVMNGIVVMQIIMYKNPKKKKTQ
ncbi:hypothetical protein M9434_006261 [Picochlorum sp. BPE23]|nr:hypothetical protein M9434_006261 [Picochlorum sp. BPE23]